MLIACLPAKKHREAEADIAVICMASLGDFIVFCAVAKWIHHNHKSIVLVCRENSGIEEFAEMTGYFQKIYPISIRFKNRIPNIIRLNLISVKQVIVAPAERHILSDLYALSISANEYIMPNTLQACALPSLKKIIDHKVDKLIPVTAVYELERYEQYLGDIQALQMPLLPYQFEQNAPESTLNRTPYIVVFPGAGGGTGKQWPVERYATVLKWLQQKKQCEIKICGTMSERELGEQLKILIGPHTENLCGKTNLMSLKDILIKSILVLANDSGSAHFSIACNVPTLVICGCWEYGRFYPNLRMPKNSIAVIIEKSTRECIPCGLSKPHCISSGTVPCLLDISVQDVLDILNSTIFHG